MRPSSFHGQTTDMTVKGANTVIDEEWFLKKFCFSELTIGGFGPSVYCN